MEYKELYELVKRTSSIKSDDDFLKLFDDKFKPINYKLYKYYPCEEHAFSNLENNIIYLSK